MRSDSPQKPSRLSRHSSALTVVISSMIALNLTSGVGFAYWSSIGSGSADIQAATAAPLGVSSLVTPLADLYPGKTSDLDFVVSNDNPYPVDLTKLDAVSVTSSDEAGCPGSTYIALPSAVTTGIAAGGYVLPSDVSVPAGSTGASAVLPGLVTMTTSAPDACQGQTFTLSLSFSGAQA